MARGRCPGSKGLSGTGTNTFPPHINQGHQPQLTGRAGRGRGEGSLQGLEQEQGTPRGPDVCVPSGPGVGVGGTPTSTLIREKVRGLMGGHRWGEVIG